MYGEHVGRRCGRQARRYLDKNCFFISVIVGGLLLALFLIPELGFMKDKLIIFGDKLGARLTGSTEYKDRKHPSG